MTPEQINQARLDLGLSVAEFGAMLDIKSERAMAKHMTDPLRSSSKPPSARMIRLIRAYLAGYRPDDWPT